LQYKWFDVNIVFSYQFGGYTYDTWAQRTENGGGDLATNVPTYYRNRWKKPGDEAKYERFIAGNNVLMSDYRNSRRVHSSDFVRLKHIAVGVSLPEAWIDRIGMNKVRLYATGSNVWTWARHDYYDPEASNGGITIWGTPPLQTMACGVEVSF
jgi:hypothetical protein